MTSTARLTLDPIGPDDRAVVVEMQTDPANYVFDKPNTDEEAHDHYERWFAHWQEHGWGYWLVRVTATGELIGIGGVTSSSANDEPVLNLYYRLRPSARGRGYASELGAAAVDLGERFDSGLPVVIITNPGNGPAEALATRLGFHEYRLGDHRGVLTRFFRRHTVRTERLVLREPMDTDLDAVLAVEGDPRTAVHRPNGPWTRELAVENLAIWRTDWRAHGIGYWRIVLAATGETVGFGGVRRQELDGEAVLNLYYRLTPAAWGHGYAVEMARAARAAADRIGLPVVIITATANTAAIRVAEKLGFTEHHRGDYRGIPCTFYRADQPS